MPSSPCPYCSGDGCSECGGTGLRVTTFMEVDGAQARISGNAELTPESEKALAELVRAAVREMDAPH